MQFCLCHFGLTQPHVHVNQWLWNLLSNKMSWRREYLFLEVLICTVQQTNNDQREKCPIKQPFLINNKMYMPLTIIYTVENNLFVNVINDVHLQISIPNCLVLNRDISYVVQYILCNLQILTIHLYFISYTKYSV